MSIFDSVIEATTNTVSESAVMFTNSNIMKFGKDKNAQVNIIELDKNRTKEPTLQDWYENAIGFDVVTNNEQWYHNNRLIEGKDKILTRSDNGEKLGNVSGRYKVVQPIEIVNFFADLVDQNNWSIQKMGYCDGGKKMFAFANTGDHTFDITGKGDKVLNHLLITTSFDRSTPTIVQPFMERFFCMNQLPLAKSLFAPIKVKHSSNFDADMIKFNLGLYNDASHSMIESCTNMTKVSVTDQEALAMILDVMGDNKALSDHSTRSQNQFMDVYSRFRGLGMGAREQGVQGTVWGVLNAITEYVDHEAGNNVNNRFRNAHYGQGLELKNDAFEILDLYATNQRDVNLELTK